MLGAVGERNGAYQNLGGHFLGAASGRVRNPVAGVPGGRPASARQPNRPGQEIPGAQTSIRTSSAKPGNREGNQRIPYARFMFTWPDDRAAPRDLQDGDIVFVHKSHGAMGKGANRLVKSTGIPQLNALLAKHNPGSTTLDLADPRLPARIKQVRVQKARGDYTWARHIGDAVLAAAYKARLDAEVAAPLVAAMADIDPFRDWEAATVLSDWTLDGVLIHMDDDELDVETPHDSRHDGALLNVCVQGPTTVRNTPWQVDRLEIDTSVWAPQIIDDGSLVMDKVFVGLFVKEIREGPVGPQGTNIGAVRYWSFEYRCFSSRQAMCMLLVPGGEASRRPRFADRKIQPYNPAPFAQGPSYEDFGRLVGVWKLGSVMDNRAVSGKDRQMTVNVAVEWWPMDDDPASAAARLNDLIIPDRKDMNWIQQLYGWRIGSAITPLIVGPLGLAPPLLGPPPPGMAGPYVLVAQAEIPKALADGFKEAYDALGALAAHMAQYGLSEAGFEKSAADFDSWLADTSKVPTEGAKRYYLAVTSIPDLDDVLRAVNNGNNFEHARIIATAAKENDEVRKFLSDFEQKWVANAVRYQMYHTAFEQVEYFFERGRDLTAEEAALVQAP